jgi:hypothetical protein
MRLQQAEPALIADLKDESEVIAEKAFPTFKLITARHPTLGKLVIVVAQDGSGAVVETDE